MYFQFSIFCCLLFSLSLFLACISYKCAGCHFWYSLGLRALCSLLHLIHSGFLALSCIHSMFASFHVYRAKTFNTCCHANNTCHSFNACNLVWLTLLHIAYRIAATLCSCCIVPRMVNKIYEHHFRRLNFCWNANRNTNVSDSMEFIHFFPRLRWRRTAKVEH